MRIGFVATVIVIQLCTAIAVAASPAVSPAAGVTAAATADPTQRSAAATPAVPPVRIEIPKLGVSAGVDELGLNDDRSLEVPTDYGRTGWYTGLEAPGQTGTAVIAGHYDSRTGPAVFFRLSELAPGDEISVALADGRVVPFVVERSEQYRKNQFPTIAVYSPTDRPTLRLITCGGSFDRRKGHYRDNVVVYANAKEA